MKTPKIVTTLLAVLFLFSINKVIADPPSIILIEPGDQTIQIGTTLTISSSASDADNNMTEHNLDIQRPDGQWNWEGGWATQWPFQGGVNGSGSSSSKSASYTFNQAGVWHIRSAAADSTGWYHSNISTITVIAANIVPSVTLTSPGNQTITVNSTLTISTIASDPDGNMVSHNIDIQRPNGEWNWQGGWSSGWPFQGGLNGNGYSSSKTTSYTFDQVGTWQIRAAAIDESGEWQHSTTTTITVTQAQGYITIQPTIYLTNGSADYATGAHFSINDNGVVSGEVTLRQNYSETSIFYDPFIGNSVEEASAGPGYVIWVEKETRDSSVFSTAQRYTLRRLKIARYIRSSRSWSVTQIASYKSSGTATNTLLPYYAYISPFAASASAVTWNVVIQEAGPGNIHTDAHSYSVPQQSL